jgi:hypothetical protein
VFTPVLAKYSKSFSLIDCISVSVDRMQRNFEPMPKQVEAWQRSEYRGSKTNRRGKWSQARANDGLFRLVTGIEEPASGGLFKL